MFDQKKLFKLTFIRYIFSWLKKCVKVLCCCGFLREFAKKTKENALYDILKYAFIIILVIAYTKRGFISEVYIGEQSVYCQLCYYLEMEQEYLQVEITKYFNNLSAFSKKNIELKAGEIVLGYSKLPLDIKNTPTTVLSLRSKIYDSLKEHHDISLAMKNINCDSTVKKYRKNYKKYSKSKDIKSLCKFRKMSFFDKVFYHTKRIIRKII